MDVDRSGQVRFHRYFKQIIAPVATMKHASIISIQIEHSFLSLSLSRSLSLSPPFISLPARSAASASRR